MTKQQKENLASLLENIQQEVNKETPNLELIKKVLFMIWWLFGFGLNSFLRQNETHFMNSINKAKEDLKNEVQ